MESIIVKTEKQLNDAFFVRKEVFVKEQHVPEEEEIDQFEDTSEHIVIYDGGQPVGAGRWRLKDGHGKLERICVMKSHRSLGVGAIIMQALEKAAADQGRQRLYLTCADAGGPVLRKTRIPRHIRRRISRCGHPPSGNDKGIQTIKSKALLLI